MAFYAGRLVLEPAMENPIIMVITDRNDLEHAYDLAKRLTRVNNAKDFFEYNWQFWDSILSKAQRPILPEVFRQLGRPNGAVLSTLTQAVSGSEAERNTHGNVSKRKDCRGDDVLLRIAVRSDLSKRESVKRSSVLGTDLDNDLVLIPSLFDRDHLCGKRSHPQATLNSSL
jgi:hypothetical protein